MFTTVCECVTVVSSSCTYIVTVMPILLPLIKSIANHAMDVGNTDTGVPASIYVVLLSQHLLCETQN